MCILLSVLFIVIQERQTRQLQNERVVAPKSGLVSLSTPLGLLTEVTTPVKKGTLQHSSQQLLMIFISVSIESPTLSVRESHEPNLVKISYV